MDSTKSPVESDAEQDVGLRRRLVMALTMNRILIDRAERWSFKDAMLAQILTQLKDAAYDAEDLLADIDCDDHQQKKIRGDHSQASRLFYNSLINFVRNLMSNTERRARSIQIQGRLSTTAAVLGELMDELGLHGDCRLPASRQTSSVVDKTTACGRDEDREKVIELSGVQRGRGNNNGTVDINESAPSVPAKRRKKENVSVVSIYGIAGVGKTTLAQIVYNDPRVADHFDLKIWICVSDNFDVSSLSKKIIDNKSVKGFKTHLMDLDSLQVALKEIATAHRFLIILDDVWNEDCGKWQQFFAPLRCGKRRKYDPGDNSDRESCQHNKNGGPHPPGGFAK